MSDRIVRPQDAMDSMKRGVNKSRHSRDITAEIKRLLSVNANENTIKNVHDGLRSSKIYIYGAGKVGTGIYHLLREAHIEVEGFLDRRGGGGAIYLGKPLKKAHDNTIGANQRKESFVVISFLCGREELQTTKQQLVSLGYNNVCCFYDIYTALITNARIAGNGIDKINRFTNAENKILKTASLLRDDESREVYVNFIKVLTNSNTSFFSKPSQQTQYFVNDVPFAKGYARFIDCGAFDGDTALTLKRQKGQADAMALFEPDCGNFEKLCKNLRRLRTAKEQILFPCGVWKQSEMLRFSSGFQGLSAISEEGNAFVPCAALDDMLRDFAPTFIKMDVEGCEYEALLGAETIIKRHAPDLAISVYHKVEDIWEIPLLINSIRADYTFYLRCHDVLGKETVLYAVQT